MWWHEPVRWVRLTGMLPVTKKKNKFLIGDQYLENPNAFPVVYAIISMPFRTSMMDFKEPTAVVYHNNKWYSLQKTLSDEPFKLKELTQPPMSYTDQALGEVEL